MKEKQLTKKEEAVKIVESYVSLPDLSIKTGSYRKVYRLAKQFYFGEWRGKEKPSPAFGGEKILASRKGFEHLTGKAFITNRDDAIKRLRHIPNAKQILETTTEIYERRTTVDKHNNKIQQYSILGKLENGLVLKVIVHETIRTPGKIFLSVFDVAQIKKGNTERSDFSENRA